FNHPSWVLSSIHLLKKAFLSSSPKRTAKASLPFDSRSENGRNSLSLCFTVSCSGFGLEAITAWALPFSTSWNACASSSNCRIFAFGKVSLAT
ncbi:hypothetical protein D047_3940B, partial [Vibrio parahaemolyticus VPTS-2010_2]